MRGNRALACGGCVSPMVREKSGEKTWDAAPMRLLSTSSVRMKCGVLLSCQIRLRLGGPLLSSSEKLQKEWYVAHGKKDQQTYTQGMDVLIAEFGKRAADSITHSQIDVWLVFHEEWTQAMRNRYKTVMSQAFTLAMQDGKLDRNPARLSFLRELDQIAKSTVRLDYIGVLGSLYFTD